jgi:phosphate transport system permease protein
MQNRAFTAAGFVATFFGLAMLVVFFSQLGRDVVDWFRQTPRLVDRQNARLVSAAEAAKVELEKVIAERDAELVKIDADAGKTAAEKQAEKQEIRELLDPEVVSHQKTLDELERNKTRDLRTDTSAGALFWFFLTNGAAPVDRPQDAGIWFALLGSLWMGLVTLLFAVPVGVGAAVYLEEYRGSSRLNRLIQLNINNLAGVPSVVYGILGAFVFVGLIFRPLHQQYDAIADRNVLGGGLTLGLLTLPVVIVAAQEAIRAVPSSIRHGAIALGATRWQTIWRTVLPMSLPGILTGTILSLSRAIGEAAPLLLFGAIMYVAEEPSPFSRFTILPMTIFGWARRPPTVLPDGDVIEAWRNNAAMASVILLTALLALNALAIYLRNRTQKRSRY